MPSYCSGDSELVRYADITGFMEAYNPSRQMDMCADKEDCVLGSYPKLRDLDSQYGPKAAAQWIIPQLDSLNKYTGAKMTLDKYQLAEVSMIIANEYSWLKVSDVMLFVYLFKTGRYGKIYGALDPTALMAALRTFAHEDRGKIKYEYYRRVGGE